MVLQFPEARKTSREAKPLTAEAQSNLTTMLDRWVGLLQMMDIDDPHAHNTPHRIILADDDGNTVRLFPPYRNINHAEPEFRKDLGEVNEIRATQVIDSISHTLHVTSDSDPFILAYAEPSPRPVQPRTTEKAMLDLCLRGEIVDDWPVAT